jgi:SpoIIAA-like
MLELISGLPANVVGVVASGDVTASDYETVLVPAVEAALKKVGGVRILYHLGPAFTGFSAGAMWDDMKLGVAHLRAWERVSVVTDLAWVSAAVRLFAFAMPCPVRVFSGNELSEATRWVSAA